MKENKRQNGITLIALVVTIVVLLILAGVSINTMFGNSGIINKANEAKNRMENAQNKEMDELEKFEQLLQDIDKDKEQSQTWTQNKTEVTNGTIKYTVGEMYQYDSKDMEYNGGWTILGAENGKLLLITSVDVDRVELYGKGIDKDEEEGTEAQYGYLNGADELDNICKAKCGPQARSVTVEDINRITGYDPEKQADNTKYAQGEYNEYGNKVIYSAEGSVASNKKESTQPISMFVYPDGRTLGEDFDSIEIKSTKYNYYPDTLSISENGETKGVDLGSEVNNLFEEGSNRYWLASKFEETLEDAAHFGMRTIGGGFIGYIYLYNTTNAENGERLGVRAVIAL